MIGDAHSNCRFNELLTERGGSKEILALLNFPN